MLILVRPSARVTGRIEHPNDPTSLQPHTQCQRQQTRQLLGAVTAMKDPRVGPLPRLVDERVLIRMPVVSMDRPARVRIFVDHPH